MPHRFYLRSNEPSGRPHRPRNVYPRWFIPVLVIVGAGLGLMTYRIACAPARVAEVPPRSSAQANAKASPGQSESQLSGENKGGGTGGSAPVRQRSFEGLRLQVLNGCGVKGLARIVTPGLRSFGFDVRETRNAGNFDYQESAVIDRSGDIGLARLVADSLGIKTQNVSSEPAPNLVDIDLTLIVGADYRRLHLGLDSSNQE